MQELRFANEQAGGFWNKRFWRQEQGILPVLFPERKIHKTNKSTLNGEKTCLFIKSHILAAADKSSYASFGYNYLIPTNITPVLLANFFHAHGLNSL